MQIDFGGALGQVPKKARRKLKSLKTVSPLI